MYTRFDIIRHSKAIAAQLNDALPHADVCGPPDYAIAILAEGTSLANAMSDSEKIAVFCNQLANRSMGLRG